MGAPGDFIVFADDSGDHGLGTINPDYPVFVLACCVFEKKQYVDRVETRERFMSDLAGTPAAAPFAIIAATIHKGRMKEACSGPTDLYSLALRHCVEQVVAFMRAQGQSDRSIPFLSERRGKVEDRQLIAAFHDICHGGNCWEELSNLSIDLIDKKANMTGPQIADLVSTPIGRHVLQPNEPSRAFEVIRRKIGLPPRRCESEGLLIEHPGK